jgi:hypothetical protein
MNSVHRIFDFRGYVSHASGTRELVLWIDAPVQSGATGEEFYCQVGGSIFSGPINIYGVDPEQAEALAYSLIKRRLAGKTLLDSSGDPIELPPLSS